MTDYAGIDYGLGQTNIDKDTGIRYGVIPVHDVTQAWCDSSEGYYGDPTCPECGSKVEELVGNRDYVCPDCVRKAVNNLERDAIVAMLMDVSIECRDEEDDDCLHEALHANIMDGTIDSDDVGVKSLWSDDVWGDEPLSHFLDDGEYKAEQCGDDVDIFIFKSPYYTRAQFCSPCAPGAGYLRSPCENGPKTYCFGPDWFDDYRPCPYPVYRVDNDECIYTPKETE